VRRLVLATTNKGKLREIRELLASLPFEIVGLEAYPDAPQVAETGATFAENARLKAEGYAAYSGELTLADDSGLEVDALGGEPGVHSARYGGPDHDDRRRYELLLQNLAGIPADRRTARFHCVAVVFDPVSKYCHTADGTVEGLISDGPRGANGFGYDPVFFLPKYNRTMAELPEALKNEISHRGRAIMALLPCLIELAGE
jgi:XTP/dITP diphosphohydrolase